MFEFIGDKTEFTVASARADGSERTIENIFPEFVNKKVSYSSTGEISSYFGSLIIDGVKIEIMGDVAKLVHGKWEDILDFDKDKEFLEYGGVKIPLLSLEREYEEYVKLGRLDTAKYIKKFMVRGK